MDFDRYFGLSTSSKNYQSTIKSQFGVIEADFCIDLDEIEEDDEEMKGEYPCSFCSEDFDLLGLCCHIDEDHPSEVDSGVCPVCFLRVGMNIVGHIATHHGNISNKSWHKLKLNKGESHSTLLTLRKELQNGHFQSLLARSPSSVSSSRMTLDPLLSFVYNTPAVDMSESVQVDSSTGENAEEKISFEKTLETNVIQSSLSDKDHAEKAKRCEFVQGLMLSTIFNDDL
ncbi:protein DEHYDRATION-INDUCED 19 homolog 4-like isoform X1 [Pistacia vera]|uniref:protein DEHYDRATION-INDUCED 19 homolog 4-like isoform X1 n=1 Tax=Pistacia vera TaxID=55513 RepID=UPI00126380E4|nr:protein DEHYDRATION-INDUCED 19 homolog 4-like isoform X1 [Pistacia vera]